MNDVTPWFPVRINPVREGWYEVAYDGDTSDTTFRLWRDGAWRADNGAPTLFSFSSRDKWRGLAKEPK